MGKVTDKSRAPKSHGSKSNGSKIMGAESLGVGDRLVGERRPPGPPSTYRREFAKQARQMVRLGATDAELADGFNVTVKTIGDWRVRFAEFGAAMRGGKDEFNDRVERSLALRALGYSYDAVKIFCTKDGGIIEVPYREHVPPDVTACIFWLKNRQPDRWRDVQHLRHSGNVSVTVTPEEAKC